MKNLILLLAMILLPAAGFAQSGTAGTLTWSISGGTLTIGGSGAMPDCEFQGSPWFGHRESITAVVIGKGVTSIGAYAFQGCYNLTFDTVPGNVTSIGFRAFCSCSGLTSVTVPGSVTSIGVRAFCNCNRMTSVTIPGSVTGIGERAFWNCSSLTDIAVAEENAFYTSIDGVLFDRAATGLIQYPEGKTGGHYAVPGSVTGIGRYAFAGSSRLTSVSVPGGVTEIGEYAFADCRSLTGVAVEWRTPLPVPGTTFEDVPSSVTLHVPAGTKALYEAADVWKDFGTVLEDADVNAETVPAAGVQVRMYGNLLSVDSPVAEQLEVYSAAGHLLYRVQKPAGPAAFDPNGLPRGVLIVRGSSGWTGKIVR